ncbi:MAG TPA: hypothetical protein DEV93_14795 [Chloroflexi bacterium]|nr:hypothetical protein [Chloroflexota bacterium]
MTNDGSSIPFVDVGLLSELPDPPPGHRYLDFLGGERELRCFVVPEETPRCEFMSRNTQLLDPILEPVYQNEGVFIRQDASYAIPGFYILSLSDQYRAIDALDETTHLRTSLILQELRRGMRIALRIEYVHVYYEEKPDRSCSVHYWVLPVDGSRASTVFRLDKRSYFGTFRLSDQRAAILRANHAMGEYFEDVGLRTRDQGLTNVLAL